MIVIVLYIGIAVFCVVALASLVGFFAYRSRDRWLVEGKTVDAGVGAFRQGPTQGQPEVQHRRWLMVPVAIANILLAIATTFFLCPSGILGALVMMSESHSAEVFWAVIGLAALDGLPLSIMLVAASIQLARRSRTVVPVALVAGFWGVVHHGALIAMGGVQLLVIDSRRQEDIVLTAIALASVGLIPCIATIVAGIVAARDGKTLSLNETG
ncbi:MAG: hypothetical protein AB8I08_06690 [Sandaracinaceae bacterium]